ncbi:MAG: helix-turn-helix domain-containing protein [Bacteroidetes bacterium]|nr:helix-turn-helix domain-containing protein [Bacteroidota bacterium]
MKTTILLMSDKSVPADKIADYLGVDSGKVYRYVERYRFLGLEKYRIMPDIRVVVTL